MPISDHFPPNTVRHQWSSSVPALSNQDNLFFEWKLITDKNQVKCWECDVTQKFDVRFSQNDFWFTLRKYTQSYNIAIHTGEDEGMLLGVIRISSGEFQHALPPKMLNELTRRFCEHIINLDLQPVDFLSISSFHLPLGDIADILMAEIISDEYEGYSEIPSEIYEMLWEAERNMKNAD